jgi:hypothetical protein
MEGFSAHAGGPETDLEAARQEFRDVAGGLDHREFLKRGILNDIFTRGEMFLLA